MLVGFKLRSLVSLPVFMAASKFYLPNLVPMVLSLGTNWLKTPLKTLRVWHHNYRELLSHFRALPGFNNYAIEMLISIFQNNVFLSEAEAHQCIWASTVDWKGEAGKNIEIDLLQENRNKSLKRSIRSIGPNKTDNAINKSSQASGGEDKIGENFDVQTKRATQSSSHSHRSTVADKSIVMEPLHTAPKRLQCMLLRLQRYDLHVSYQCSTEINDFICHSPFIQFVVPCFTKVPMKL